MITKARHVFEEKQKIRFQHLGTEHEGIITAINASGDLVVHTRSGHTVLVHPENDFAEPFDWPQLTTNQLEAVQRAMAAGKLDPLQKYQVEQAVARMALVGRCSCDDEKALLNVYAECVDAVGGDTFAKRAGAGSYKVGDRIRDAWGHLGKIKAINEARAEITYDSGIQGTVLLGYFKSA